MPQISTYTLSFTGSSQDIKDTKTTIDETLNVQDSYYSYDNIVTEEKVIINANST